MIRRTVLVTGAAKGWARASPGGWRRTGIGR